MSPSRFLSRTLLAATFVEDGISTLLQPEQRPDVADDVLVQWMAKTGVVNSPQQGQQVCAGVQITAACLLAAGKWRRLSSVTLLVTTVPTTYSRYRFWGADLPAGAASRRRDFVKNLGLIGGLVLELVDTEGAPSLGWRARRSARRATKALTTRSGSARSHAGLLADAPAWVAQEGRGLRSGADVAAGKVAGTSTRLARKAHRLAEIESENLRGLLSSADFSGLSVNALGPPAHRAGELLSTGASHGAGLLSTGASHGADLLSTGAGHAADLASVAADHVGDLASTAKRRAGAGLSTVPFAR